MDKEEIYFSVLNILLKKAKNSFYWSNLDIYSSDIQKELESSHSSMNIDENYFNPFGDSSSIDLVNYSDFNEVMRRLQKEEILHQTYRSSPVISFRVGLTSSRIHPFGSSGVYSLNVFNLKNKIKELTSSENKIVYQLKEKISELDEKSKSLSTKLRKLKKLIDDKKNESEIHKFIKKNDLFFNETINYEFQAGSQNRFDFLILNEYQEYELWELKCPSDKLFTGKISDKEGYYTNLKKLQKSAKLTKAIEQALVYKKYLIDQNGNDKDHGLPNHIYNAKLVVVIGSDEELDNIIITDKLNLERHSYNNLNIITYEMLYKKIENSFKHLLENENE